ncbi:short-chain dehydrogenase [Croceibacterium mercuriale]|uniref:Short-chain dehydrogenase n=1 Tax=Croceibacterium mercuriale TaxID=1572751 RepID=A0A0B2C312_9SPHN|nr:SDR family oxidoreductase [Croceibacterium mercuriale]KHL26560.1 short-chain dehydrogenase [Croceibacterium mercuriale]
MRKWTLEDMPRQDGRVAVVTGTGGLGLEVALALCRVGAEVVIAGRDPRKGAEAIARIEGQVPAARARFELLDLASLASVMRFAERLPAQDSHIDLLVNNAGVMVPPARQQTADGFELQFGTNHLGHFALTGQLLPLLRAAGGARVVSVSSVAARSGSTDWDDWNAEGGYSAMPVYARSKIACLMFALELQRRSAAAGWAISSIAAHPGVARTELLHNGPGRGSLHSRVRSLLPFLFQPAAQGALPLLFAATSADARPGGYYAPDRLGETRGYPADARIPRQALDQTAAERLWAVSEGATGVRY